MKKLLLITEKTNQTLMICAGLYEHGVIDANTRIDTVHVMPMSWWHFKIPSHIPMANVPFTDRPGIGDLVDHPTVAQRPAETNERYLSMLSKFDVKVVPQGFFTDKDGERRVSCPKLEFDHNPLIQSDPIKTVAERLDGYDQVIVSPDSDHSGWSSAYRWLDMLDERLKQMGSKSRLPSDTRAMWLHSGIDPDSVYESYRENTPLSDPRVQQARRFGDAKRVFDYWWLCNSAAVFSKLQKQVDVERPKILSKYELMTLHLLALRNKPISENNLLYGMQNWLGTGKYLPLHDFCRPSLEGFHSMCLGTREEADQDQSQKDRVWGAIGSPMSRHEIITNLVEMGLVEDDREGARIGLMGGISITDRGRYFIARCHKSTFDPDLPFRLSIWCESADYDKMERYIRTVFGKQKRFLSKSQHQPGSSS